MKAITLLTFTELSSFARLLYVCLLVSLSHGLLICSAEAAAPLAPFLKKNCIECHDAETKKGGFNLDGLPADLSGADAMAKWVRVHDRIASGEMPPPKKKEQPAPAEKAAYLGELSTSLTKAHTAMKGTVMRRLNRTEYLNTMEALLGMPVPLEARAYLPDDTLFHGFDNIGEALGMSDVQLSGYMKAAELTINALMTKAVPKPPVQSTAYVLGTAVIPKVDLYFENGASVMFRRKVSSFQGFDHRRPIAGIEAVRNKKDPDRAKLPGFVASEQGDYRISVTGWAYQSKKPVSFALHSGPQSGGDGDVRDYGEVPPEGATVEFRLFLNKGDMLRIGAVGLSKERDHKSEGLGIRALKVEGPFIEDSAWPPRGLKLMFADLPLQKAAPAEKKFNKFAQKQSSESGSVKVISTQPEKDAERLLSSLAGTAFRRPATDEEVATYMQVFASEKRNGEDFTTSLRTAAIAVLSSPQFLYLAEPPGRLAEGALAARLSYFLWRTRPDAELLALAEKGQLSKPDVLRMQTERLLSHPNAQRFVNDFTDSWLNLRNIAATTPEKQLHPEFEDLLQESMLRETRGFVTEMLKSNLPMKTFIKPDFAMLNRRLAEHYGIAGVEGVSVRKVPLPPDSVRGGLMSQASILKVSANGTATSPVIRGVFVMDRLLGQPPQPPPPNVPGLEPDTRGATTIRQLLDKHRSVASCNSCHAKIDPPGFAMESFDVIGGWRDRYVTVAAKSDASAKFPKGGKKPSVNAGLPVDASGQMADGASFKGFADFQNLLLTRSDALTRCVIEKLATFASGREMGFSDRPQIEAILRETQPSQSGLRDVLHGIVQSEIFLNK